MAIFDTADGVRADKNELRSLDRSRQDVFDPGPAERAEKKVASNTVDVNTLYKVVILLF